MIRAGFYGADINEKIHVFPRGGSDITGSLVALAAGAINQGAGKLNLLVGVPTDRYKDAIRQIYKTIECTDMITFY